MFEKKIYLVLKLLSNVKTKRVFFLHFCGLLEKHQVYKPKKLILKINGLKDFRVKNTIWNQSTKTSERCKDYDF